MSLERETQELMEFSKPDKSRTLVDSFYEEQEREIKEAKQRLYSRIQ